jgi:hypothetical protein
VRRRNKIRVIATLESGHSFKAWKNAKTGEILPTNWKTQAGFLALGKQNGTKRANAH